MKLITSFVNPPIPWRKFDWCTFDEEQMGGICNDPECACRNGLVRGWGETEEKAIKNFISDLLERCGVDMPLVERA